VSNELIMMTPAERPPEQWAAEVARLERPSAELQQRVHWYEEQCRLAKHRQFGASQERADTVQLQLLHVSLFGEHPKLVDVRECRVR
jgi:hypothetical protein